jgi:hypothetical protein
MLYDGKLLPAISVEEFNQRVDEGENIVLLEDIVVDVEQF